MVAYTGTEKDVKQVIKARDEEKRMAVQKLEEYALNREALKGLRSKLKRLADAGKPAVLLLHPMMRQLPAQHLIILA